MNLSFSQPAWATLRQSPISWAQIPGRGRGVVTCRMLRADAVLDVAPAIPTDIAACDAGIAQYLFVIDRERREPLPKNFKATHALVFGMMSFCNHAHDPNARVYFNMDHGGLEACLIAIKPISVRDEVTIAYPDLAWYRNEELL